MKKQHKNKAKVLIVDVETAPLEARIWTMYDPMVGLNQITKDWFLLSFSAKWLGDPASKTMYFDQRNAKVIENDKLLVEKLWKLLDSADIVVGQNSKRFDIKKIQARMVIHKMKPPSPFKQIDTLQIASKKFGFTSKKLEYMTDKLCTKYKKKKHKKFGGMELWNQCLAGNKAAWEEMRIYNRYDVLSTEELYKIFQPWDNTIDFNVYEDDNELRCNCGSDDLEKRGFHYGDAYKYQRYTCRDCGAWFRGRENLAKRSVKKGI